MEAVRLGCACHSTTCDWISESNISSVMFVTWPVKASLCWSGHPCLARHGARGNESIRSTTGLGHV
eukprot:1281579-Heterocapsa_arctica.AAC.1